MPYLTSSNTKNEVLVFPVNHRAKLSDCNSEVLLVCYVEVYSILYCTVLHATSVYEFGVKNEAVFFFNSAIVLSEERLSKSHTNIIAFKSLWSTLTPQAENITYPKLGDY